MGVVKNYFFLHLNGGLQSFVSTSGKFFARKECHDCITDVFVNEAIVLADDGADAPKIGVDKVEVFLRRHLFRHGGK